MKHFINKTTLLLILTFIIVSTSYSQNSEYDKKAISIVKKAAPYPRIPKDIVRNAVNGDLILGFPL